MFSLRDMTVICPVISERVREQEATAREKKAAGSVGKGMLGERVAVPFKQLSSEQWVRLGLCVWQHSASWPPPCPGAESALCLRGRPASIL